uniref:Uncharacterized protein n=1 Tax=Candidatus Kentrum sp. FW TaxID=2126338 RepID=A0A450S827_9GAMM|nr:MAG: hypothetical protein BECKFW1821A_GA0114235_101823 [Candidatus Kentron sp. FW]
MGLGDAVVKNQDGTRRRCQEFVRLMGSFEGKRGRSQDLEKPETNLNYLARPCLRPTRHGQKREREVGCVQLVNHPTP